MEKFYFLTFSHRFIKVGNNCYACSLYRQVKRSFETKNENIFKVCQKYDHQIIEQRLKINVHEYIFIEFED